MKTSFWLLDINSEFVEGHPETRLWGLDDKGQRILIRDNHFLPYFYLILDSTSESGDVIDEIEKMSLQSLVKIEAVNRHYFGKEVNALKLTVKDPSLLDKYAAKLSRIRGVSMHLEDDIRYSYRYLIDNDVSPCRWHEIDVEETQNDLRASVQTVYRAVSAPKPISNDSYPPLRILSLFVIAHSSAGSPKPEINPVDIITCITNSRKTRQFVTEGSDDKPTMEAFIEFFQNYDPDIIATFGGNTFELPFLLERTKRLKLRLQVDRLDTEPHRSTYGHISVTGRANVDLFSFTDEIGEIKVKTLKNIATFLGVPEAKFPSIENVDYANYWNDPKKRLDLLEFSLQRAKLILGLANELLGFAEELSSLSGLPLDQVGPAAVGFRIESHIIRRALNCGELIPQRLEHPYFPYQGGIVLNPEPGLHEDVVALDFKSMYPNLMIKYNISPDTYVAPEEPIPPEGVNTAPEAGHRFRKEPLGIYNRVLRELIQVRDKNRLEMKKLRTGTPAYKVLDARQRAVKIMTNATYGYAGWIGARWYVRQVAEAAAAWGRYTITKAIEIAEKMGLNLIYGDTDSIFMKFDVEKVDRFIKEIYAQIGLEIRPDEIYKRILFTEAKKRYAGLLQDETLDIVGFEFARGDWTLIAKNVQEGALKILLKEKSPEQAAANVREQISLLRAGKVPLPELIIWKTLTKNPTEYAVKAAHVAAAKRLTEKGWEVTTGDKIGYVILKGKGKLYDRATPYAFASEKDLDLKYYEEQQIIPPVLRVLSTFNITEKELLPTT
ncbi:DNA polymerase II [Candidatus Bathyarchaeota archaeon]|nr:DNA polymerase II [Candidatus Bathyarchaeota archaeon]